MNHPVQEKRLTNAQVANGVILLLLAVGIVAAFIKWPIEGTSLGIDWHAIWTGLAQGHIRYDGGLRNPPWIALTLLPLGWLPFQVSWGIINLLTLVVVFLSVPRPGAHAPRRLQRRFLTGLFLLIVSWPLLRQLADGNVEWLVIAGAVIAVASLPDQAAIWFAVGILFITAKAQEGWLLLIVLGGQAVTQWSIRRWLTSLLIGIVIVVPTFLWLGAGWLHSDLNIPERGSLVDMSWQATANRIGLPGSLALAGWLVIMIVTVVMAFATWRARRPVDRVQAGNLIAASLLLAPYSAGNSVLAVLAIGVIPLFLIKPSLGLLLVLLCDAPIVMPTTFQFRYGADFATLTVLILWGVLGWATLHPVPDPRTMVTRQATVSADR